MQINGQSDEIPRKHLCHAPFLLDMPHPATVLAILYLFAIILSLTGEVAYSSGSPLRASPARDVGRATSVHTHLHSTRLPHLFAQTA